MADQNKVFRLIGKVQHYAWGGNVFLPRLLGADNPEKKPFAEYWLGAHDAASAEMVTPGGDTIKLNEYIRMNADLVLGSYTKERFGSLPYLLKILDVKDMLSIQVHPSKSNAENEFAQENKKGIDLNASYRNYKDDNHKPELMTALGEFWLLHGFKKEGELKQILKRISELNFLLPVFIKEGYEGLYKTVMDMEQEQVNEILEPLLDSIIPAYENNGLKKTDENFWAARAALTFNEPGKTDRGIFSIYFFNLLQVQEGEAVFQDAGLPHAYLEGQNVEIMANSDNVLRGGLTPKHIDVNELMKHVKFEATIPNIIRGTKETEHLQIFKTPAPDFELAKITLTKGESISLKPTSAEIFMVFSGRLRINENAQNEFEATTGESFVSFYQAMFKITADENSVIYRAGVPPDK